MAMSHGRSKESSARAHSKLLASEESASNLALGGVQPSGNGQEVFVMLRCPCCGTSLYKPSTIEKAMALLATHQSMLARSAQALADTVLGLGTAA